jgi:inhibitor of KinA sporulation pathway (predicted exonuclease)
MTIRRDQIVIVDVEATCWENQPPPPGERNEIIEIGVCLYDVKANTLSDKRSIFVKPTMSKVSPFCTQLTTITAEQLEEQGIEFSEACEILEKEYRSRGRLWGSWGNYDRRMFKDQCKVTGVHYPFSDRHFNIKQLFAKTILDGGQAVGMSQALEIAGLPLEGVHHRGGDDAWNIGRLLQYMVEKQSINVFQKFW